MTAVRSRADTYVPGPPYWPGPQFWPYEPASRVPHVPKAQGSLPPGHHALYVRRTCASLGRAARAVRTAYRGTPGEEGGIAPVRWLSPPGEEAVLAAVEQIVIRRDRLQKHLVRLEGDTLMLVPPAS